MPLLDQAPLGGGVGRLKIKALREEVHRFDVVIIQVGSFFRSDIAAAELCTKLGAQVDASLHCPQIRHTRPCNGDSPWHAHPEVLINGKNPHSAQASAKQNQAVRDGDPDDCSDNCNTWYE